MKHYKHPTLPQRAVPMVNRYGEDYYLVYMIGATCKTEQVVQAGYDACEFTEAEVQAMGMLPVEEEKPKTPRYRLLRPFGGYNVGHVFKNRVHSAFFLDAVKLLPDVFEELPALLEKTSGVEGLIYVKDHTMWTNIKQNGWHGWLDEEWVFLSDWSYSMISEHTVKQMYQELLFARANSRKYYVSVEENGNRTIYGGTKKEVLDAVKKHLDNIHLIK